MGIAMMTIAAACGSTHPSPAEEPDSSPPDAPESTPDATEECVVPSCEAAGATCGVLVADCGAEIECGSCVAPDSCGGGGVANQCGFSGWESTPVAGRIDPARHASLVRLDGRLAFSYYDDGRGAFGFAIENSDGTWSLETIQQLAEPAPHSRNTAVVTGDGAVHVLFYEHLSTEVRHARRSPEGVWSTPVAVGVTGDRFARLALAARGDELHAFYDDPAGLQHGVLAGTDAGWTVVTLEEGGRWPSVSVSPSGAIHLAYLLGTEPTGFAWRVLPVGGVWTEAEEVDAAFTAGPMAIAVDAKGGIHIMYSDEDSVEGELRYVHRAAPDAPWLGIVLGPVKGMSGLSLGVGSDGVVHAVYQQDQALGYAYRRPGGSWTRMPLGGPDRAAVPSMVLDGQEPAFLYFDYQQNELFLSTYR